MQTQPQSFRDIVDILGGPTRLSRLIDVPYHRVYKWHLRDSIPSRYWPRLIAAARDNVGVEITVPGLFELIGKAS